jgi:hypothetical protein
VVHKGFLSGLRKPLNLRGWNLRDRVVRSLQVLDHRITSIRRIVQVD